MAAVAIRAFHQSFRNAVMNRLRKLSSDRCVAGVTKVGLRPFQQTVFKPPNVVRALGNLKEMLLSVLKVATTVVFHLIHEVARMAIAA
jgi:hypothetical protein